MLAQQERTTTSSESTSTRKSQEPLTNQIAKVIPDRSAPKVKRTIKKRDKTRTGCYTCKFRRVKCDETKPFCNRCIRFGVDCDGYPAPPKPPPEPRALIPRERSIPQLFEIPHIFTIHAGQRFEDQQEARCFKIFCEEAAPNIGGPFKTSLWNRLIPQTSEVEPFVRHAAVAIGAMSKFRKEVRGGILPANQPASDTRVQYYTYALTQFDKALRGMRNAIANGEKSDMRTALLACILVVCFETLTGSAGTAITNAESGLMLLHGWMLANMKQKVPFFMSTEWQDYQIEEDLMTALAELDLHILFFLDSRPKTYHVFMIDGCNKSILHMPKEFTTLRMARLFWSLIMRRNYHFIIVALAEGNSVGMCGPWTSGPMWEDAVGLFPGGSMFSTPKEPATRMIPDSLRYREEVKRWSRASASLFGQVQESGTQEERTLVTLLQIHELMSYIMLASTFFYTELSYDTFLPQFRKIMSLIRHVYPHLLAASGSATYHFDLGIIIALFLVGTRCRVFEVRKEAMGLCLGPLFTYKEGFWDAATCGSYMQFVEEIEAPGRDENGFVPEYFRAFVTHAYMELPARRGIVFATQTGAEGLIFHQKYLTW